MRIPNAECREPKKIRSPKYGGRVWNPETVSSFGFRVGQTELHTGCYMKE